MSKTAAIFMVLLALLVGPPANADPLEDAIAQLRSKYEQVYNAHNLDKLVDLYTKDVLYFGVSFAAPELVIGSDNLRKFFSRVPQEQKIKLGDFTTIQIAPNVLISSGYVEFTLIDGKTYPFRLTWALVKVDDDWLIAQSHTSNFPKK